jgi:hypothetical protein
VAARKIAQEITLQKRGRRVKNLIVVLNWIALYTLWHAVWRVNITKNTNAMINGNLKKS